MTLAPLTIRPSRADDLPAIQAIYAQAVTHGTGTFELEAPDLGEMTRRRWPWLPAELSARCEALGARQMLAVIGDSANAASVGVHRTLGFDHAGVLKAAGWKFGRWLDVVLRQRVLGTGGTTEPVVR